MPSVTRGAVTIELPETWMLEPRRRQVASIPGPDGGLSPHQLAQAIGEHFEELEVLPLVPTDTAVAASKRRRSARESKSAVESASLKVAVGPKENAVLLIEQDGVYSWVQGTVVESGRRVRGVRGRTVSFELELLPSATAIRSKTRGFKLKKLLKPLKVFVFKFLGGVAVGQVVKRFERDIKPGLVMIRSSNPDHRWTSLQAGEKRPTLTKGRQARVLLLVHGTFSSTEGGYGHLKASQAGRQFLDRAIAQYDLVIGFDHRTLSEDPKENADQLWDALKAIDSGDGIEIEAVSHSRGALVLRSLVEHILDPEGPIRVTRAIMVAGPNAGTRLAAPNTGPTSSTCTPTSSSSVRSSCLGRFLRADWPQRLSASR